METWRIVLDYDRLIYRHMFVDLKLRHRAPAFPQGENLNGSAPGPYRRRIAPCPRKRSLLHKPLVLSTFLVLSLFSGACLYLTATKNGSPFWNALCGNWFKGVTRDASITAIPVFAGSLYVNAGLLSIALQHVLYGAKFTPDDGAIENYLSSSTHMDVSSSPLIKLMDIHRLIIRSCSLGLAILAFPMTGYLMLHQYRSSIVGIFISMFYSLEMASVMHYGAGFALSTASLLHLTSKAIGSRFKQLTAEIRRSEGNMLTIEVQKAMTHQMATIVKINRYFWQILVYSSVGGSSPSIVNLAYFILVHHQESGPMALALYTGAFFTGLMLLNAIFSSGQRIRNHGKRLASALHAFSSAREVNQGTLLPMAYYKGKIHSMVMCETLTSPDFGIWIGEIAPLNRYQQMIVSVSEILFD